MKDVGELLKIVSFSSHSLTRDIRICDARLNWFEFNSCEHYTLILITFHSSHHHPWDDSNTKIMHFSWFILNFEQVCIFSPSQQMQQIISFKSTKKCKWVLLSGCCSRILNLCVRTNHKFPIFMLSLRLVCVAYYMYFVMNVHLAINVRFRGRDFCHSYFHIWRDERTTRTYKPIHRHHIDNSTATKKKVYKTEVKKKDWITHFCIFSFLLLDIFEVIKRDNILSCWFLH